MTNFTHNSTQIFTCRRGLCFGSVVMENIQRFGELYAARLIRMGKRMPMTHSSRTASSDCCNACQGRKIGFCSWFDGQDAHEILSRTSQTHFAAGSEILKEGEPANRIGIILSGLVKIVLNDEDGDEHVIQLLHRGGLIGDPLAEDSSFSWQAATDVDLCWVPASILATAMPHYPTALYRQLHATIRQTNEHRFAQIALRGRTSAERVAHWLFLQVSADTPVSTIQFRILLTRRDLASLLEMTVETLSRSLHQLEHQGAIVLATPELIEVRDLRRLKFLSRARGEIAQEKLIAGGWEWGIKPT